MKNLFNKTNNTFLLHSIIWLLVWFTISFLASKGNRMDDFLIKNLSILIPLIVIVYINWFWLFPRYFAVKRYWQYGVIGVALIYFVFYIGEIIIVEWIDLTFPDRVKKDFDFDVYALPTSFWKILNGSAPYTLGLLSSTIILVIGQKRRDEQETAALRLENAQTKIKYLQSQISPHFLFNSLNNVHSLILQDKKHASDYVIKLSDLLRFMIYETDKNFISLGEEINVIKRYASLADFRIGSAEVSDNLKISITNTEYKIPPLLLLGILENGIKHSGMGMANTFEFNMVVEETQGVLTVEMNNSISEQKFDSKKKGFGIESLKKRLQMNYPKGHTFVFQIFENSAKTVLTLNLDRRD
ncbi:histidine kinase [Maribacter sp.]|nr:histidine kinase [Maribacter sp.]